MYNLSQVYHSDRQFAFHSSDTPFTVESISGEKTPTYKYKII